MNRDFKGVWIPKNIWIDVELSWMEKLFIVEIDSLDNENHCFASNSYFAEFFQLSKPRCTQIIKSLEAKGFLSIKLEWKGKAVTKRTITVNKAKYNGSKNIKEGGKKTKQGGKDSKQGVVRKLNDSNTESNNTINNFLNDEKKEAPKTEKKQIFVNWDGTFTDNGNLKTNSDENNYIDFTDEKINFGYLGKCKGLFQTYLNLLTFSEYEDKIIKGIFYSIKDNLTAYNKKQGTNTPIQDKNVLDALKIALQAFTIKPLPSGKMNLVYFRGSLNANVYIKIDDTAKLLDLVGSEQRANYYKIAARDGAIIATEKLRNLLTKQGKI